MAAQSVVMAEIISNNKLCSSEDDLTPPARGIFSVNLPAMTFPAVIQQRKTAEGDQAVGVL